MPTVLIVEDDVDIRESLEGLLVHAGYTVATASDGAEALAYMRSHDRPCVVLLDLMMPVMNGRQLRVEMQKDPSLDSIPVVVLSGGGRVEEEAAALGAVGYVTKPFQTRSVLSLIQQHC